MESLKLGPHFNLSIDNKQYSALNQMYERSYVQVTSSSITKISQNEVDAFLLEPSD